MSRNYKLHNSEGAVTGCWIYRSMRRDLRDSGGNSLCGRDEVLTGTDCIFAQAGA
jgi:hypothetical protein